MLASELEDVSARARSFLTKVSPLPKLRYHLPVDAKRPSAGRKGADRRLERQTQLERQDSYPLDYRCLLDVCPAI